MDVAQETNLNLETLSLQAAPNHPLTMSVMNEHLPSWLWTSSCGILHAVFAPYAQSQELHVLVTKLHVYSSLIRG